MHTHIDVHTHIHTHTGTRACSHTCAHAHTHSANTHVHTQCSQHTYTHAHPHTCMHTLTHVLTQIHTHMHTHNAHTIHTCTFTCSLAHMHTHAIHTHTLTHTMPTHMHVHACMHTHTHAHAHTMHTYMYTHVCSHGHTQRSHNKNMHAHMPAHTSPRILLCAVTMLQERPSREGADLGGFPRSPCKGLLHHPGPLAPDLRAWGSPWLKPGHPRQTAELSWLTAPAPPLPPPTSLGPAPPRAETVTEWDSGRSSLL